MKSLTLFPANLQQPYFFKFLKEEFLMNLLFKTGILSVFLLGLNCKVVTEDNSDNKAISIFRVANGEIGSWKEKTDGGYSGIISNLGDLLNGGKEIYEKQGIVQGFDQKLAIGADAQIMDIVVLEYASESNSTKTMQELDLAGYFTDKQTITGYPDSVALVGKNTLSGCKSFAHFGVFFFIIQATGFANTADAIAATEDYLSYYKSKANTIK
jgi:hypothetical protein